MDSSHEASLMLVTCVGASHAALTYTFDGHAESAHYAGDAIRKLLRPKAISRVLIVHTQKVVENARTLEGLMAGLDVQRLPTSEAGTSDEALELFESVVTSLPEEGRLVLDLTHGPRQIAFLVFAAALYKEALNSELSIERALYCFQRGEHGDLVDVTVLKDLVRWALALTVAREHGSFGALKRTVGELAERLFRSKHPASAHFKRLPTAIKSLDESAGAGLPIELGIAARSTIDAIRDLRASESHVSSVPLRLCLEYLNDLASPLATAASELKKHEVKATANELKRQLAVARFYAENGDVRCLLCLRELIVNWVMLASGSAENWLDYGGSRRPAENQLNYWSKLSQNRDAAAFELDEARQRASKSWDALREKRNRVAHAGMSEDKVNLSRTRTDFAALCDLVEALVVEVTHLAPLPRDNERVLLTPLGNSPGVLFSALKLAKPTRAVVVCSAESRRHLEDVAARAGFPPDRIAPFEVHDPYGGVDEHGRFVVESKPLFHELVRAESLIVNMTGGTTVMQVVVQKIARKAQHEGAHVRDVAVVDRRSPIEQKERPFELGELVDLADDAAEGFSP